MILPVIALALLAAPTSEPVGRRIVVPLSSGRGRVEVLAHAGEGVVDVVVTGPGGSVREMIEKQAGELLTKLEVVEQVQDKLHLRLFTRTPFAHASASNAGNARAVIDLRLHGGPDPLPIALTPSLLTMEHPTTRAEDRRVEVAWTALDVGELAVADANLYASKDPRAHLLRGEVAMLRGDARAALALFRAAREVRSTAPYAELRLVDLEHYKGEKAYQVLLALNQRVEGDIPAMLARARLLESGRLAKNTPSAMLGLEYLAEMGPPPVAADALARIARLHRASGHPDLATQALLRAAEVATDASTRNGLRVLAVGAYAATLGRLERAGHIQELVDFGEQNVELSDAHADHATLDLMVASAARKVGKIDIALRRLMKVAAADPPALRDRILVELVGTYVQAGDLTRARTVLAYADESKRGARSPELARARADIAALVGEHSEAHTLYLKSAQLSPRPVERAECMSLAADAAFAAGDPAEAKAALEGLLALPGPRGSWETEARLDLGILFLGDGEPAKAASVLAPIRTSSVALGASEEMVAAAVFFEAEAETRAGRPLQALVVLRTETSTSSPWARFVQTSRAIATVASKEGMD